MRYLISDIHGCYDQYRQLLQKINFSSQDELYVLGDAVDRGSDPIKVLQDLMRRPNVIYILGNHDLEMYLLLNKLTAEITEKNCETQITSELLEAYSLWLSDGGAVTVKQFRSCHGMISRKSLILLQMHRRMRRLTIKAVITF